MEIDELNHTPRETAWGSFLSYSIFQILIYRGVIAAPNDCFAALFQTRAPARR